MPRSGGRRKQVHATRRQAASASIIKDNIIPWSSFDLSRFERRLLIYCRFVSCLRQSRRLERLEPLKAVGLVTPVLNADLRGQKPMRRFRSPQGPALRAGQFSAAALWQALGFSCPSSPCRTALATVPPQKTLSEAPHRLLLADPRRTNRR
jgi:hypothetical protein